MKTRPTVKNRRVVTPPAKLRRFPVETYSDKRIGEFDQAEAGLAKVLRRARKPRR